MFAKLPTRVKQWMIPLLRGYIRYGPDVVSKRALWARIVEPYFAWEAHSFVAPTVFGTWLSGTTNEILQQYVYYFGLWEPHVTAWIRSRLRPGDVFIDVGANIGYYSLLASRLVGPEGAVVAIEPSPKTFGSLRENLIRNRARNVRAVNVAAAGSRGVVKLFTGPADHTGLTTMVVEQGLPFECEVEAAPLSEILRPEEIHKAHLIKIDVEGAEAEVVKGMELLLNACRSDLEILIEVHTQHLAQRGEKPDDVLRPFLRAGFHAYALENDYSPLGYLAARVPKPPEPIRGAIEWETNVVLSRSDLEHFWS